MADFFVSFPSLGIRPVRNAHARQHSSYKMNTSEEVGTDLCHVECGG